MADTGHILIVDDEAINRELLEDLLASSGLATVAAESGFRALEVLNASTDLVLLDVMMPGIDGFAVAELIRVKPEYRDVPIVMVTALNSKEDRLRAVAAGANDFITKPIDKTELQVRTASLLKMKAASDQVKGYQQLLERTVEERTGQLRDAVKYLAESQRTTYASYLDTVRRLALASEYKDACTGLHLTRVSEYCAILGRALGFTEEAIEILVHASSMHDVGKLGIPDSIILKPGCLSPDERSVMQAHTTIGAHILSGSESELLRAGETIARTHHERWDGTGYPNGLAGEAIPILGRICAVADVFDALTSKRSYKPAYRIAEAVQVIEGGSGSHFDPNLVRLFLQRLDEVTVVHKRYRDGALQTGAKLAA